MHLIGLLNAPHFKISSSTSNHKRTRRPDFVQLPSSSGRSLSLLHSVEIQSSIKKKKKKKKKKKIEESRGRRIKKNGNDAVVRCGDKASPSDYSATISIVSSSDIGVDLDKKTKRGKRFTISRTKSKTQVNNSSNEDAERSDHAADEQLEEDVDNNNS
ncbi:hypothetical protein QYF36_014964 [Acer negundo]|nr:hypothetical protein QYF36_014964 [Acer negundo]